MKKNKSGISLIVLVITIIIMIILAGTIILSLSSSGIIENAKEAKADSDTANLMQVANLSLAEYELENRVKEDGLMQTYIRNKVKENGFSQSQVNRVIVRDGNLIIVEELPADWNGTAVTLYQTSDKQKVPVPIGFTVDESITTKEVEGIVIISDDENRNEFVWIPVRNFENFTRTEWSNNAAVSGLDNKYTEPLNKIYNGITLSSSNDLTGEYSESADMNASVQKYKGFYIARYEAGDGDAVEKRRSATSGAHKVVSKKGAYVYNYVGWGNTTINPIDDVSESAGKGAVWLSRNMYPNLNKKSEWVLSNDNNTGAVSTLVYGLQWDAILRFILPEKNVTDSSSWGNYSGSPGDFTTGGDSAWIAKNIYDLAGNMREWTMEAYSDTR